MLYYSKLETCIYLLGGMKDHSLFQAVHVPHCHGAIPTGRRQQFSITGGSHTHYFLGVATHHFDLCTLRPVDVPDTPTDTASHTL